MDWSNPASYAGWLQLAGGVVTLILQIVSYFTSGHVSVTATTTGAALLAGGYGHIANGRK